MVSSPQLLGLVSVYTALATASPIYSTPQAQGLSIRQENKCTDLHAVYFAECWDQLDIPGYLNDPIKGWKATTPKCISGSGDDDGRNCCTPDEHWSTCFLRLATGTAGLDCSAIDQHSCIFDNRLADGLDPSIAPKVRYVVRNIFSVGDLFISYHSTLQQHLGFDDLSSILSETAHLDKSNLDRAISASLPFWGTPSVIAGEPQGTNATLDSTTAQTFLKSVQQAKEVSDVLWNGNSDMAVEIETGTAMTTQQGIASQGAAQLLSQALSLIMGNIPTFLDFVGHGRYSDPVSSSPILRSPYLFSAPETYVIGQVLSQNKFSATPMPITSKEEFHLGKKNCTSLGDVCKDSKNNAYYRSPVTQMQYQISFSGDFLLTEPDFDSLYPRLQDIEGEASVFALLQYIETKTVAHMPVLFDGAYNCTLEGKAGGSSININADGTLDVACLSAVPIYLSKDAECPPGAVFVDGKCPFGFNN